MINVTSQISGSVSDHRSRADISCRPCAFDHLWWRGLQQPHQACDSGLLSPWVQTQGPYFVIHEKRNLQRGGWSRRASPAKFEAVPREWQVALWSSSTSPCSQECICPVACWRTGPIFWQIFRWSNGRLGVQFARSCLFPKRCYLAPARPGGGQWHVTQSGSLVKFEDEISVLFKMKHHGNPQLSRSVPRLSQAMSDRLNSLLVCPLFMLPESVTCWHVWSQGWFFNARFMVSGDSPTGV